MSNIASFYAWLVDRSRELLTGETLRFIGYGAIAVVWIVTRAAIWLHITSGTAPSLDAIAAAVTLAIALVTELARQYVWSPNSAAILQAVIGALQTGTIVLPPNASPAAGRFVASVLSALTAGAVPTLALAASDPAVPEPSPDQPVEPAAVTVPTPPADPPSSAPTAAPAAAAAPEVIPVTDPVVTDEATALADATDPAVDVTADGSDVTASADETEATSADATEAEAEDPSAASSDGADAVTASAATAEPDPAAATVAAAPAAAPADATAASGEPVVGSAAWLEAQATDAEG